MADESVANVGNEGPPEDSRWLNDFLSSLGKPDPAAEHADPHAEPAAAAWDIPAEVEPSSGPAWSVPTQAPAGSSDSDQTANMDDAGHQRSGWQNTVLNSRDEAKRTDSHDGPAATWGIPAGVAPSAGPAWSVPIAEPAGSSSDQTYVFMGPAGAGKTCLLAAMNAACYAEAGATTLGLSIMCDGESKNNERLLQSGVDWIGFDAEPSPTLTEAVYSLELAARRNGGLLGRTHMEVLQLRCVDGPGELCFPQLVSLRGGAQVSLPISKRQIHQLAVADALVLVVDATQPCVATIEASLPRLLDRIAASKTGEPLPQSRVARILSRLGLVRGQSVPRRTRVSAGRVLLLLTKVDVLATAMAHELAARGEVVSAAEVAWAIDPLALAMEVVGGSTLRRLCRSISTDSDFAVGVCSASGFRDECGRAFSRWSRGRSPDERLKAWVPFGVREALQYITLGRCERTVQRVTEAEIRGGEKLAIHDFAFQEVR